MLCLRRRSRTPSASDSIVVHWCDSCTAQFTTRSRSQRPLSRARDLLRGARYRESAKRGRPDADAIAARILGGVERLVGTGVQIVQDVLVVHAIGYEPDAHRHRELGHSIEAVQAYCL